MKENKLTSEKYWIILSTNTNKFIKEVPEREQSRKKEIMTKISPNILKNNSLHIQQLNLSSIKEKKKSLKAYHSKNSEFPKQKNILKEVLEK